MVIYLELEPITIAEVFVHCWRGFRLWTRGLTWPSTTLGRNLPYGIKPVEKRRKNIKVNMATEPNSTSIFFTYFFHSRVEEGPCNERETDEKKEVVVDPMKINAVAPSSSSMLTLCARDFVFVHTLCPTLNLIILLLPSTRIMSLPLYTMQHACRKSFLHFSWLISVSLSRIFHRRSDHPRDAQHHHTFSSPKLFDNFKDLFLGRNFVTNTGFFGDCRQQFVETETQPFISTQEK